MALNLQNAKEKFINALFGTPVQSKEVTPSISYGQDVDNYLNNLGTQPYMQGLLNQPKETGLTLDQYKQGVANGLDYGIPEIADMQDKLGIRKPQTEEERYQASLGYFNQPTTLNIGASNAPRKGGFFNDLASGYRENATQGFDIQNLAPQNKGLATRIGEGLGTLTRFYNKPIGRMAVATGLSMLTDEANPLGEGVKAYVGRQQYQTADKVYRNQLKQLGMTDEELNAIKGNITKDIFEGVTSGMRLGNQRMTYGQLAMLDEEIAREVAANPALANQFVPVNFARDIYSKKRDTAEGKMAQVAAEVAKTEKETDLLGEPKPKTVIEYITTNKTGGSDRPTKKVDYKNKYGLE